MPTTELNTKSIQAFSMASLIFGILAPLTCFTGFLPLVNGGLSILFAVLSHREDRPFPALSWWGIFFAVIGLFMGALILVFVINYYFIPMMTDPAFYQEMNTYYMNNYGISLDDLWKLQ
ncbi:MAG: hypothetical protein J5546_01885 [Lachnospiraceae bacterium]|nr:hypothetical protein [Lachnospiraceae bacterium]